MGAVGHCSRIQFDLGIGCASAVTDIIGKLLDVSKASNSLGSECGADEAAPAPAPKPTVLVPTPTPVPQPAPTILVPTPVPTPVTAQPTILVPTPVPTPVSSATTPQCTPTSEGDSDAHCKKDYLYTGYLKAYKCNQPPISIHQGRTTHACCKEGSPANVTIENGNNCVEVGTGAPRLYAKDGASVGAPKNNG